MSHGSHHKRIKRSAGWKPRKGKNCGRKQEKPNGNGRNRKRQKKK